MFILSSKPDPVGTEVEFAFTLPGSTVPLKALAKVVRAVQQILEVGTSHYQMFPPGNGLAFVEMAAEHRRLLNEFCDREETRIFGTSAMTTHSPMAEKAPQVTQ